MCCFLHFPSDCRTHRGHHLYPTNLKCIRRQRCHRRGGCHPTQMPTTLHPTSAPTNVPNRCTYMVVTGTKCFEGRYWQFPGSNPVVWQYMPRKGGEHQGGEHQFEIGKGGRETWTKQDMANWQISSQSMFRYGPNDKYTAELTSEACRQEHVTMYKLKASSNWTLQIPTATGVLSVPTGNLTWVKHNSDGSFSNHTIHITCTDVIPPAPIRVGSSLVISKPRRGGIEISTAILAWIVNGMLFLAAVVLTIQSYSYNPKGPSHSSIMQVALALSDVFTDLLLLVELYHRVHGNAITMFWAFLACQIVSLVFNAFVLLWTFKDEAQSRVEFQHWYLNNNSTFICILTFSCMDMQTIRLIYSRVFDLDVTKAPISITTRQRLSMASYVSLLFENIPQIIVELTLYLTVRNNVDGWGTKYTVLLMALALSGFDILQSIVGLSMWLLIGMHDEKKLVEYERMSMYRNQGVETLLDEYRQNNRRRNSYISLTAIEGSRNTGAPRSSTTGSSLIPPRQLANISLQDLTRKSPQKFKRAPSDLSSNGTLNARSDSTTSSYSTRSAPTVLFDTPDVDKWRYRTDSSL